jgi:hypothetical protein
LDCDDYLKFCHENYRDELKEKDQFIPRQGFLLSGIVVLAGVVIKLATLDRINQALRVDIFCFYLATLGALVSLSISIFHLIRSHHPREYEKIAGLAQFDEWREKVRKALLESGNGYTSDEVESLLAVQTRNALTTRLNTANERNVAQNDAKSKLFNLATYAVFWAVGFLAIQMFTALIYELCHGKGV